MTPPGAMHGRLDTPWPEIHRVDGRWEVYVPVANTTINAETFNRSDGTRGILLTGVNTADILCFASTLILAARRTERAGP